MLLISGSGKPGNSDWPKAGFLRKIAISNWFSNVGFTTVDSRSHYSEEPVA